MISAAPLGPFDFPVESTPSSSLPESETISPIFLAIRQPVLETSMRDPIGSVANRGDIVLKRFERAVGVGDSTKRNRVEDVVATLDIAAIDGPICEF